MMNCANLLDLYHSIDILVTNCCCSIVADAELCQLTRSVSQYRYISYQLLLLHSCRCWTSWDCSYTKLFKFERSVYIFLEFTELVYLLYINSKTADTEEHRYFSNFVEINDKEYCDHTQIICLSFTSDPNRDIFLFTIDQPKYKIFF